MPSTENSLWLVQRAVLAVALMIGFYLLAISLIAVLLWIPYEAYIATDHVNGRVTLGCLITAFTLASALIPRRDRFEPPGPQLSEADHPQLFALIRELAAATSQPVPEEVYLVNEVNAWVAQRGGVMGFGSRPIMGIGLPLVQSLTVDELKSVLAHEFGHYLGADVKIGPWIYKTRAAIGRAIVALETNIVGKVFVAYGHLFMRLTMAVSRHQEFVADAVSARITAPAVSARTLRRIAATAPMFPLFVREEVAPLLRAGYLPPLAEGFDQFLRSARVTGLMTRIDADAEAEQEATALDTHPPLAQRLAALSALPATAHGRGDERPASVLSGDIDSLARELLRFSNGDEAVARLRQIGWKDVPQTVFLAGWRATAETFAVPLARFTFDTLPIGEQAFVEAAGILVRPGEERPINRDAARDRAIGILSAAMGAALVDDGWQVETAPGEPIVFVRGEHVFNLGDRLKAAAAGELTAGAWRDECARLGLIGRPLAPGAQSAAATVVSA